MESGVGHGDTPDVLVVALAAAQIEVRQIRHLAEGLHAGVAQFVAAHSQCPEVREAGEPFEADVSHQGGADIERFEQGESGNMLESGVAGLGAVQVEALETFPVFDGGDTLIGHVLGEIEIEIGNAAQVLDLLHAAIGDVGEGKIKGTQGGIAIQAAEIGIGDPGSAEADGGDEALRVARHSAAEVGDPLSVFACRSFATG